MNPISITLHDIAAKRPCTSGWEKLLASKAGLPHDVLFHVTDILDSNGLDDCWWVLRCLPAYDRLWRRCAVWHARQAQHLMSDPRSVAALDVADRHWQGLATDDELAAAWVAAVAVAAWADGSASEFAARAAARAAESGSAESAARTAALAAWWVGPAARDTQSTQLRAILTAGEWVEV